MEVRLDDLVIVTSTLALGDESRALELRDDETQMFDGNKFRKKP